MSLTTKIVAMLGATVAVCALLYLAFVSTPLYSCENRPIYISPSPDGRLKAMVFSRDCGATTGFSTQVSILEASSSLSNAPGNAFTTDSDHGPIPSGQGGGSDLRLRWLTPQRLLIEHPERARVFLLATEVSGVHIEHAAFSHDGV